MGEGFLDDTPTHHTRRSAAHLPLFAITNLPSPVQPYTDPSPYLPAPDSLSPSRVKRSRHYTTPHRIAQFETYTQTLETIPAGATHWSTRSMAKACGLSAATVSRIWRAFGLKPHRTETFKLSRDPLFIEKVRDIVGLCLHPPERAVVLCVDEKPQIQALERSQPVLPMRPGLPERRTHDYRRPGTTSLFAALDVATGEVLGRCFPRHRAVEFRRFLDDIAKAVPEDLEIHLVLDNYGTHKTAMIHDWLAGQPRFHLHFTPTSASWMNQVERWFAAITEQQTRRGTHRSTTELEQAIDEYFRVHNESPKPFIWTKSADQILESLKIYCERISETGH